MSTLKDVAALAGVSTFTASRVLSGRGRESRISEARIAEVQAAAQRCGYRANASARATRERRTRQVGVLLYNNPARPGYTPQNQLIVQGVNYELERFGYLMVLVRLTDLDPSDGVSHRAYLEQCVDGIVAAGLLPPAAEESLEEHFPSCVWVDCNTASDSRCLRRDEELAGRLPVEHAARVGYKRVVYVDWQGDHDVFLHEVAHYSTAGRRAGAQAAAAEHGLDFEVVRGKNWPLDDPSALTSLMSPDTLVLAYSVGLLRTINRAAMEAQLRVGADFGLACCESCDEFEADWPDLCHSKFDRFELGVEGAQRLLEEIESRLKRRDSGEDRPAATPAGEPWLQKPELFEGKTAPGPKRREK